MNGITTKLLRKRLRFSKDYTNGELVVTVRDSLRKASNRYACYLVANKNTISTVWYQKSREFRFNIRKPGFYSIKVYLYDRDYEKKVSVEFDIGFLFVFSQYYERNKLTYINSHLRDKGEAFLEQSLVCFNGFPEYQCNRAELWTADPFCNRTWRWNLLQLSLLNQILSVHAFDPLPEYLQAGYGLLESWNEFGKANPNDNECWHDHGTALRLKHICAFFIHCLREEFVQAGDEKFSFMLCVIQEHIAKLRLPSFYNKFTNHGFDQSLVLYQVCSELEHVIEVDKEIKIAANRIIAEVNHAFCSDGGHKENSPEYLYYGIKQCLTALNIEVNYSDEIKSFQSLEGIIDKATEALIHTVKPDGTLPLIGDTSLFKINNIFRGYKPAKYEQFLYVLSQGKQGTSPQTGFFVLPKTGYAFIRNQWDKNNYADALHFCLKAGYLSKYHRHDDDLTITLYGYGEDWLVDGGTYKHDNLDVHREYIRSHNSHNLSSPLNCRVDRNLVTNAHISAYENETDGFLLTAVTNMFETYIYSRKIKYDVLSDAFHIEDTIRSMRSKTDSYISRFFLGKGKTVSFCGNSILVEGNAKTLRITVTSELDFEFTEIKCPREKITGWLSDKNFELYQSSLVEVKYMETNLPFTASFLLEFV